MGKQYKLAIVFGRFQIFHVGHKAQLDKAFEVADKVIIFIGSANQPRTINNPFTFDERWRCICRNLPGFATQDRVKLRPLYDYIYDDERWKKQIDDTIAREGVSMGEVCLLGGSKGEWYMDLFPEYARVLVEKVGNINSTELRRIYFNEPYSTANRELKPFITPETAEFLADFRCSKWYGYVHGEYAEITDRLNKYGKGPHLTCDNIILKEGKILLVKRKNHPGKGLWALPGGFLNAGETFEKGAFRELQEETTASITFDQFRKYCIGHKIYDHPNRSVYTHIITSAYCVSLPKEIELKVEAADDAEETKLFPLSEVKKMKNQTYDDHWDIIEEWTAFEE